MIDRTAEARWEGDLREGHGTMRLGSGAFEGRYSFGTRFEGAQGTNPEELIGAAHAGCFSMALSAQLSGAGAPPERIETKAEITFEKVGEGFAITASHLTVSAKVPGLDAAKFQELATKAKEGCPVSKVLNATITMDATLVG